jgi:predicted AlkP superfamily phosphohydrolase/phosphomutase
MQRVCLVGLDSATFDLIRPWAAEGHLPQFRRLMEEGAWGPLRSTIPPVTAVAWNGFATGMNPGKHGVFDFVRRAGGGYDVRVVSGASRKAVPFWRVLDEQGLRAGILNVPMTYPPDHLRRGFVVSGFDAPGLESDFTHPPQLKARLLKSEYVIAPSERTLAAWDKALLDSFDVQKQCFLELARTQDWDVLVMVFMQLDQVQHLFWREMAVGDPRLGGTILRCYRRADALLGEVWDELDDDTTLMVISDHGAGPLKKAVSINQWLRTEGYLVYRKMRPLKELWKSALLRTFTTLKMNLPSSAKARLKERLDWVRDKAESYVLTSQIEWSRTRAFSLGEYGGIFINLDGRETEGVVRPEDYEQLRGEIAGRLVRLKDPDTDAQVIRRVYRREQIYDGPYVDQAPDLVLDWDYGYDCRERVGSDSDAVFDDEAVYLSFADYRKTGVHRLHGVLLMHGAPVRPGSLEEARLIDVAPTLLHLAGASIPDNMDGEVITGALTDEWLERHPICRTVAGLPRVAEGGFEYSSEDEAMIREQLRALGYLE